MPSIMRRLRPALAGALICMAPAAEAACAPPPEARPGAEPRPVTPEDLARLRDIGMPDSSLMELPSPLAISPDGSKVAFLLNQADPTTNSYCRLLMVASLDGGAAARVVDEGGELITIAGVARGLLVPIGIPDVVTPAWSPDGRSIGYLRRDHGITQLWRVGAEGGDAAPITSSPVDIEDWAWAAKDLVVVMSRPERLAEEARIDAEGLSGWHYDARIVPEYGARPQMRADLPRQIETIDTGTGRARPASAAEAALLPPERVGGLPADPKIVSRNGDRAWVETDSASPLSPSRVHLADAEGRETRCAAEQCAGGLVQLYWSEDQRAVIYLRREGWARSQMALYRWEPARGAPVRLFLTNDVLLGCVPRRARFVCTSEASSRPRRVVEIDPGRHAVRTIYDPNPEFAALQLGKVERLTWRNDLGLPAWGDLVLPPGRQTGNKLPMVVVQYHSDGFLRGGTGDEHPIFALAARGFAVLSVEDPPTFATAFPSLKSWDEINAANTRDWAERRSLLSSILTGVAKVVARGIVDPKRIGITGLSDGASTARFALINSRVFSAAAISASSLEPKTSMTYGGIAWADQNRRKGYPLATEDAPSFWKPASIALNARDMNVPLLIQAAEDEYLLALETFTALRENGKPVEMFVYPNEHHIKWQPAHRLAVYERSIDWFAFWFQNIVDPDPAKAAQYDRWKAMRARLASASTSPGGSVVP